MTDITLERQLAGATDINAIFCVACGQPDGAEPSLHDPARCAAQGGTKDAFTVAEAVEVFDRSCMEFPDLDDHARALHCAIMAVQMEREARAAVRGGHGLLLEHFRVMQDMASRYLEPGDYVDRKGVAHEHDGLDAHGFIDDVIYMLDGPEQRHAQAQAEQRVDPGYPTEDAYLRSCRADHWHVAQLRAHGIEPDPIPFDAPHYPPDDHVFSTVGAKVGDGSGDAAVAIGEHAFRAGFAAGDEWRAVNSYRGNQTTKAAVDAAWSDYDPPEHIKELS